MKTAWVTSSASCGWLTDFSTERNYCAYSYLAHLDRVRDEGQGERQLCGAGDALGAAAWRRCSELGVETLAPAAEGRTLATDHVEQSS